MRCQLFDPSTLRPVLHHVPDDILGHAPSPHYAVLPDGSKQPAFAKTCSGDPTVDGSLNPKRHGHRAHVTGFAYQVDNRPMSVSTLNSFDLQVGHLRSSKAATKQETQHSGVSFAA